MAYYTYKSLRENLERNSGAYSSHVLRLFNLYIQTMGDLPTIDCDSVTNEVLNVLKKEFENFTDSVPRDIRRKRDVSELIYEVISLLENN